MAKGQLTSAKRKKIEDLVLSTLKILDNKKMLNYKRYEALFKVMDDAAFEKWANSMGHELDDTIQMYQLPFEEMTLSQIEAAAKHIGVPLEEYVWYYHNDKEGIRTKMRVPTGYIPVKRVQQLLSKKNRYATDNEETSLKSGQVRGQSKVASISDPETFFMTSLNANRALEEFLGPRADNQFKKQQMYQQIARDGYTSLDTLESDISKSTTLNTIDAYFLASGISTDLTSNSLKTNHTINKQLRDK